MTRREWNIGLPVVLALLLCLAAYIHGMGLANGLAGLSSLRVFSTPNGQRVASVIASHLQVFDSAGNRVAKQSMHALGFTEDPGDMDWTVDSQGVTEAWFFEDTLPRVVRCVWNEERNELEKCSNAISGGQLKVNRRSRAVHLAVDRPGQRIFVTDAKGGVVQAFDFSGRLLAKTDVTEVPLNFPNKIRYLGNNTLLVGDNDNGRAVWLKAEPSKPIQPMQSLYASGHGGARIGHSKVTDAVISPTGVIWMLALRMGQRDGDILVYDSAQKPVGRAQLRDAADPLFMESLGDALLVGDFSPVRLYRVDASGRLLGDFGGSALRAELLPLQRQAERASQWRLAASYAAVFVFLAGAVLTWRYSERPVPRGRMEQSLLAEVAQYRTRSADVTFPLLITPSPESLKAMRQQMYLLGAVSMIGVVGVVWMYFVSRAQLDLSKLAWQTWVQLFGVLALPLVGAGLYGLGGKNTLLVSEATILWLKGKREVVNVPLSTVWASGNGLLLGKRLFMFHRPARTLAKKSGTWMFDSKLVQQAILARLPEEHLVDDAALQRELLKRNVYLKLLAIAVGMATLVIIGRMLYQSLF